METGQFRGGNGSVKGWRRVSLGLEMGRFRGGDGSV